MSIKTWLAGGLAVTVFALAGCGDGAKNEVPKDLNQPLPPPPVGAGGKVKGGQPPPPSECRPVGQSARAVTRPPAALPAGGLFVRGCR